MNNNKLEIICKRTSELTEKQWLEFVYSHHEISTKSIELEKYFDILYRKNIYGDSIHTIAYLDNVPLATNAHLRNDLIDGVPCYQSLHTYVSPKLRRMGIFGKMSKLCVEACGEGYIYGFANNNSYPGFVKMGWAVLDQNTSNLYWGLTGHIFTTFKQTPNIPDDYLNWRITPFSENFYVVNRHSRSLLVRLKRIKNIKFYVVIGEISPRLASNFKAVSPLTLFTYKNSRYVVKAKQGDVATIEKAGSHNINIEIPIWRSDAFS